MSFSSAWVLLLPYAVVIALLLLMVAAVFVLLGWKFGVSLCITLALIWVIDAIAENAYKE